MKKKSFKDVNDYAERALKEVARISNIRQRITKVRDQVMRGAATKEEVFLALNDASTNLTIFEAVYSKAAREKIIGLSSGMEEIDLKFLLGKIEAKMDGADEPCSAQNFLQESERLNKKIKINPKTSTINSSLTKNNNKLSELNDRLNMAAAMVEQIYSRIGIKKSTHNLTVIHGGKSKVRPIIR